MTSPPSTDHRPGSLVSCRGRRWVVMPPPPEHRGVTLLRPVDGAEEDAVGIYDVIEPDVISGATYPWPEPARTGDLTGAALLRDALRLSLRAGAGPFRSVDRLLLAPRPYQYAPLAMALRLDPVRLLIADDVGVGKTIEAALVARELLDRGIVRRIGVLCPPHLCQQWADELRDKFGIETAIAQPSRMARLERELPRPDIQVFAHYRHIVASIDYIKSDHYRQSFVDNAPDLIIVDEAHAAARPKGDGPGAQQQRHRLLRELAANPQRHIILTTATPHSGVEESFRSLLGALNPQFDRPPEQNLPVTRLAPHLIQRRRSDLQRWMGAVTPFPERENVERQYTMSPEGRALYEQVLEFCRSIVSGATGHRRRVRYWAAVAILRCVLSSPAAAEATLRRRMERLAPGAADDADAGEQEFIAQVTDSAADRDSPPDYVPSAALNDRHARLSPGEIRQLNGFLEQARQLAGPGQDPKLAAGANAVAEMLRENRRPIVYCRFIHTARYVAEQLQSTLADKHPGLIVRSVTGGDGNDEQRREIIHELAQHPVRALVATDCLSEGINLQDHFDAVLHYDLPWNPNRLEQREGRVDRYGQTSPVVKTVLLWGANNDVDLTVLRVLIRKAREIRRRLGISIAAPVESDAVLNAVIDDIISQGRQGVQLELEIRGDVSSYHQQLDAAAERESGQRAYFAQTALQPDEIARELRELEPSLGDPESIRRFVHRGIQRFNGSLESTGRPGVFVLRPGDLASSISGRWPGAAFPLRVAFDQQPRPDVHGIVRNGPVVSALADAVLSQALAPAATGTGRNFARSGAVYTDAVTRRTIVLLLRLRYLLDENGRQTYAEEVLSAAFHRVNGQLEWLPLYQDDADGENPDGGQRETALTLLSQTRAAANMEPDLRAHQVAQALAMLTPNPGWESPIIQQRQEALQAAHRRIRGVVGARTPLRIQPHSPDVIGCYVLVPRAGE